MKCLLRIECIDEGTRRAELKPERQSYSSKKAGHIHHHCKVATVEPISGDIVIRRLEGEVIKVHRGADYGHAGVRGMPAHLTALNTCRPESVEKQHKQARLYISGSGKL